MTYIRLTLLHSERPKLSTILVSPSAIGLRIHQVFYPILYEQNFMESSVLPACALSQNRDKPENLTNVYTADADK